MNRDVAKFLITIGLKFVSDRFLKKLVIEALYKISKKTDNTIDDKMVSLIANSMNRKDGI